MSLRNIEVSQSEKQEDKLAKSLELVCCRKWQKSPNHETGLENRGHQKVLNDTKLVLNEHK